MDKDEGTEVSQSSSDKAADVKMKDECLSDNVELLGKWKLEFGVPETNTKTNNENPKSKKRKKNQDTSEKKDPNANERLLCKNKTSPVISKVNKCVVAVHENGLDLLTFDLSSDTLEPKKVQGHEKPITSLAMICDGDHVVSGGEDCNLNVWKISRDSDSDNVSLENIGKANFDQKILRLRAHPRNKVVLLWLESNLLKLRHINDLKSEEVSIQVQDSDIQCLSMNVDQIIYSTNKGQIYVWSYEDAQNPVFNFETGHEEASLVEVVNKKMASWTLKQNSATLWNLDTRQKMAEIHLNHPPTHLSLFQEEKILLIANSENELLLYQIHNMPPSEVRRIDLAKFDCTILSLTHPPDSKDLYLVLESGAILNLDIVCDLSSNGDDDGENADNSKRLKQNDRKGSFSCQIL